MTKLDPEVYATTIRMSRDLAVRLRVHAFGHRESLNDFMVEAVRQRLDRIEEKAGA